MQRGITQTTSSDSSSTLLPCNFNFSRFSVPRIHPTSQLCHSPLRLPEKHRMPRPSPQHGLNIKPPPPPSPRMLWHSKCAQHHRRPSMSYLLHVCVCVRKCFACAPRRLLSPLQLVWDRQRGINHSYDYYNLLFNLLAANVKAGRCVAGLRESAWGREEAETGDLGATVWRSVTNTRLGPVNTSSQSVTETQRGQRWGGWAVMGWVLDCCAASSGQGLRHGGEVLFSLEGQFFQSFPIQLNFKGLTIEHSPHNCH